MKTAALILAIFAGLFAGCALLTPENIDNTFDQLEAAYAEWLAAQTNQPPPVVVDTPTTNAPPPVAELPAGFPSEIDGPVTWLHTDVSSWPVTSSIQASVSGGQIRMAYDKSRVWPVVDNVNANPWVFVKWTDGKWYAATFEWFKFGQTSKPVGVLDGAKGDHIKRAPLSGWRPKSGERIGLMVSGLARSGTRNVKERTTVEMVTWP